MQSVQLLNIGNQSHVMKESLRALKTNLRFCGEDKKTILITSTLPDEGKSTSAVNLAYSLTESGKNVLLIDADIRKSVLVERLEARTIDGSTIYGLSHFLSGQNKLEDVLCVTSVKHLYMIFAGPSVPNPTELLDNKYFSAMIELAKKQFDYIIVDSPPVAAAIDATVISKHCDGAILVVAQGVANSRLIMGTKKQLEVSGIPILGVVLSKMKASKKGYAYGYGYGKYYGSYYGDEQSSATHTSPNKAKRTRD